MTSSLTSNRKSVILLKGKTFDYPLSARDIFLKMDLWTNVKAFTSYLDSHFLPRLSFEKRYFLRIGLSIALRTLIIYSLVRIQEIIGHISLNLSLLIGLLREFHC